MFAAQDLRAGGRQSDSNYQYTLISADLDLLAKWAPIVAKKFESRRRHHRCFQRPRGRRPGSCTLTIDRQAAASLGVRLRRSTTRLNNAFAQRQISTIYTQRNQYQM